MFVYQNVLKLCADFYKKGFFLVGNMATLSYFLETGHCYANFLKVNRSFYISTKFQVPSTSLEEILEWGQNIISSEKSSK